MDKLTVISVDDNSVNLMLIEALTKDLGFSVKSFISPLDAIKYLEDGGAADIILTDYMMPGIHGVDLIKKVRAKNKDMPVVMITAVTDDNQLRVDALEAGATEFLNKPLNPTEFKARLNSLSNLRVSQLLLKDKALLLEDEVKRATKLILEREHEALLVLGRASDYKDPETGLHINRVATYSALIMKAMGGSEHDVEVIFRAAPLHDIGKIGIPDDILLKPGRYTPEEFEIMKKHAEIGREMLSGGNSQYLRKGAEIAYSHHEKYNGTGYPNKLAGENIPISGRIVAVADVFDALTTTRPYKEAWSIEAAIDLLHKEKGAHFDSNLIEVFDKNVDKVVKIYHAQQDELMSFENFLKS